MVWHLVKYRIHLHAVVLSYHHTDRFYSVPPKPSSIITIVRRVIISLIQNRIKNTEFFRFSPHRAEKSISFLCSALLCICKSSFVQTVT